MAKEKTDSFDRDFGYLMPFFDKVNAAAANVQNPAAREELARLLNGEKARWERIRALLSGASPAQQAPSSPAPGAGTASVADMAPAQPASVSAAPERARSALTVGSLRRR